MINQLYKGWKTGWMNAQIYAGRAPRYEYWGLVLINLAIKLVIIGILLISLDEDQLSGAAKLMNIVTLPPALSALVRRYHDAGQNAWQLLALPVLFIAGIVIIAVDHLFAGIALLAVSYIYFVLVVPLFPSAASENKYGPNPHEEAVAA